MVVQQTPDTDENSTHEYTTRETHKQRRSLRRQQHAHHSHNSTQLTSSTPSQPTAPSLPARDERDAWTGHSTTMRPQQHPYTLTTPPTQAQTLHMYPQPCENDMLRVRASHAAASNAGKPQQLRRSLRASAHQGTSPPRTTTHTCLLRHDTICEP